MPNLQDRPGAVWSSEFFLPPDSTCLALASLSRTDQASLFLFKISLPLPNTGCKYPPRTRRFPSNEPQMSHETDMSRWCLYLPGICMHAVPASCRQGSGDLHLELDPFPTALKFQSLSTHEAVIQQHAGVGATCSPPIPDRHPGRIASTASTIASSSSEDFREEQEENWFTAEQEENWAWLTVIKKAFENTSTSVAASQMRNALTALADTVKDPQTKEVSIIFWNFWVLRS